MHAASEPTGHRAGRPWLAAIGALVLWAPVPLGSNRPWSSAMLALAVGLAVSAWALARALDGAGAARAHRAHRTALAALGLWLAYTALQAAPLGASAVSVLAPDVAGAYARAAAVTGAAIDQALSADRSATLHALLRHGACVGIAFLVLAVVDSRRRLRFVLVLIATVGFLEAAFGIAAHLAGEQLGLWSPGRGLTGTYVNRNHLAGLLELCIPAAAALLWLELASAPRREGLRGRALRAVHVLLGPGLLAAFALLVMTAALLLTGSRAGLAGALAGLGVATVVSGWGRADARVLAGRIGLLAAIPVVAAAWLGAAPLVDKLVESGLESNRADLRAATYAMIADRPLVGSGAGTFEWVFPAYKHERLGGRSYEHAHNDLLQVVAEQGLMGAALVGVGVGLLLGAAARAALSRRDATVRAALFAALGGTSALLVHGLVDFNLQIPANALVFFLLLGLGGAAAAAPRSARAQERRPREAGIR